MWKRHVETSLNTIGFYITYDIILWLPPSHMHSHSNKLQKDNLVKVLSYHAAREMCSHQEKQPNSYYCKQLLKGTRV